MTSVLHTTKLSILNPRAAKMPETRESTPGSFWTRQLSICLVDLLVLGSGVSYMIELTAAEADHEGGLPAVGNGEIFLCKALYAIAEVLEEFDEA